MAEPAPATLAGLLDTVIAHVRLAAIRPFLLGIAGPPAVGKSAVARRLARQFARVHGLLARFCPMDGFHLPNARLDELGLRPAKGRIDTFDAEALLAAIRRLAARKSFWWPTYSRTRHEPEAAGIWVTGEENICVIEGNYLLADAPVWRDVTKTLHLRIFLDAPDDLLRSRLLARHEAGGRTPEESRAKIERVDMPNAERIRARRSAADIVIDDASVL